VTVQPSRGGVMRIIKNLILLMIFAVLASVFGTCLVCGKAVHDVAEKSRVQSEADDSAIASYVPIDVSAVDLGAAYKTNEVSADNRYKGKVLRVSGVVDHIAKDILDDPHVILRSQDSFGGVSCSFGRSDVSIAQLVPGQSVVVRGIGDGYIVGSPRLRRCIIESADKVTDDEQWRELRRVHEESAKRRRP